MAYTHTHTQEKEEQRHAKKTKGAGAGGKKAGATDAGQHGAGKEEDAGMNEHARGTSMVMEMVMLAWVCVA